MGHLQKTLTSEAASVIWRRKLDLRPAARGEPAARPMGDGVVSLMAICSLGAANCLRECGQTLLGASCGAQEEVAIRLAIGATRWAIVLRQLLVSAAALRGGAADLAVANWTLTVCPSRGAISPGEMATSFLAPRSSRQQQVCHIRASN